MDVPNYRWTRYLPFNALNHLPNIFPLKTKNDSTGDRFREKYRNPSNDIDICQEYRSHLRQMGFRRRCEDFKLLIWKNFLLKWRRPSSILAELLYPTLACLLVCLLIITSQRESYETVIYNAFDVDDQPPSVVSVHWSPCGNPSLLKFVEKIVEKLNVSDQECYNEGRILEDALQYVGANSVLGIQFQDSLRGGKILPKKMKATLRFSEQDMSWLTNLRFPDQLDAGPRESYSETGAMPYYHRQGFLTLQAIIAQEFLQAHSDGEEMPKIKMRRFPYPAWVSYEGVHMLIPTFIVCFLFAFLYAFGNVIRCISLEKEIQIKEVMKIMNLPNGLHWTAWYVTFMILSLIPVLIVTVLMKVHIFAKFAVFPLINPVLLFIFLLIFVSTMIILAFGVSVFFSRSNTASIMGGLVFFATAFAYFPTDDSTFMEKLGACLLSNAAFGHGVKIIVQYESMHKYLTFENLFTPLSLEDDLTLGLVILMLILDGFIYLLITLYVEAIFPGEYGLARKWNFPFTKQFWRGRQKKDDERNPISRDFMKQPHLYEPEPSDQPIAIEILHLTKKFGKNKVVLRNLSFNMFQNQVTVLLGHNGSGKTTTMSVLTGIRAPTDGTAFVNGHDIRTDMKKIRENLGFCPQHNVLFDNLTVQEHLYFYCMAKGLRKKELEEEVESCLKSLDLTAKRKTRSKHLSGGMKRKLCVGIALCGKSKICVLDEPTSGMDPNSRRKLWDVIQTEKMGRAILLSTHFMNEADLLGDRIAILANGRLQCYGSSFFLKKTYGKGYRLIIVKTSSCDVSEITKLLKKFIPEIETETDAGRELTYILPESKTSVFERALDSLEGNRVSLGIESYGICIASLEEVFMKFVPSQFFKFSPLNLGRTFRVGIQLDPDAGVKEVAFRAEKRKYSRGCALYFHQVLAMFMKKALTTFRAWVLLLIHLLLPILFGIIFLHTLSNLTRTIVSSNLDISLNTYDRPIVTITTENSSNAYYSQYKSFLDEKQIQYMDWNGEDMVEHMLNETKADTCLVRDHFIVGVSFTANDSIVAWFNNQPYHSPPLALQLVVDSVIAKKLGKNYSIQFSNHPAPRSIEKEDFGGPTYATLYALAIGVSMSYVTPYFAIFYVKERRCHSKHLQLVSGTAISAFWLVAFFWDFIIVIVIISGILIVMYCFNATLEYGSLTVLLLVFTFAMLPMAYLMSLFFKRGSSAYSGVYICCLFTGLFTFVIALLMGANIHTSGIGFYMLLYLFLPHYNLMSGVYNITNIYYSIKLCDKRNKLSESFGDNYTAKGDYACELYPTQCCDLAYYSRGNGIGLHLIFACSTGLILFLILFIYEYRFVDMLLYAITSRSKAPKEDGIEDEDVKEEQRLVRSNPLIRLEYAVVLKDVTKYYHKLLAVNQICLAVKANECFGLLGVNGAGKTTTFKMMTGEIRISRGDVWIAGVNVKRSLKKSHRFIGYCPQFDALLENLTVKETLIKYCLIRGVPLKDCGSTARELGREFKFTKHLNKRVSQLSGGNKRKLSVAVALIGEPPAIFLDEPSTGMDPATKRCLWNTLCRLRDNGKCLILTTHSMDECEAICTRVGIMVNGAFQCLGSVQYLKSKFSDGYVLNIKAKRSDNPDEFNSNIEAVKHFVQTNFSTAELRESHESLLTYVVKDEGVRWSKVFQIMEKGKQNVEQIEDYSLSQFDLEQIYLLFTKKQDDADAV